MIGERECRSTAQSVIGHWFDSFHDQSPMTAVLVWFIAYQIL